MGLQGDIDGMYIVQNATFLDTNYWTPFPPWVLIASRAVWGSWLGTFANFLQQTIPILAGETYRCSFDIEITGNNRGISFHIGDVRFSEFFNVGSYHRDFELTPTGGTIFQLDVGQASGDPSTFAIDNIWVWGKPGGSTMFGNFADSALSSLQGFRFEETSAIGGDNTYRAANRKDKTRINIRYTP